MEYKYMSDVLYAAYGSNIKKERLLKYVNECTDKTEPENYGHIYVPYRMYFAKESKKWGRKGTAFITCGREEDEKYHTMVRLWKVTKEQFNTIFEKEGCKYYYKLYLGENNKLKTWTFTGCWLKEKNSPSEEYVNCIKQGIKETTNWPESKIENYLNKFI